MKGGCLSSAKLAGKVLTLFSLLAENHCFIPSGESLSLKKAKKVFDYIEIFTNGTLIDDSCIEFFKERKVNVAATIYADNTQIHDKVTQHH
jgi:hypothetical protein